MSQEIDFKEFKEKTPIANEDDLDFNKAIDIDLDDLDITTDEVNLDGVDGTYI